MGTCSTVWLFVTVSCCCSDSTTCVVSDWSSATDDVAEVKVVNVVVVVVVVVDAETGASFSISTTARRRRRGRGINKAVYNNENKNVATDNSLIEILFSVDTKGIRPDNVVLVEPDWDLSNPIPT